MPSMKINYNLRGYNIPECMSLFKDAFSQVPGFTYVGEDSPFLYFRHAHFNNHLLAVAFGNYYWGTRVYFRWALDQDKNYYSEILSYPHDGMDNITNPAASFNIIYNDTVLFIKVAGNLFILAADQQGKWYGLSWKGGYGRLEQYYNEDETWNSTGAIIPQIGAVTENDQYTLIPVFPRISGGTKLGKSPLVSVYGCTPFPTGDNFYTLYDGSPAYVISTGLLIKG